MRVARGCRLWRLAFILLIPVNLLQTQPTPRLTPANDGNIVITATSCLFLIAEQEGMIDLSYGAEARGR